MTFKQIVSERAGLRPYRPIVRVEPEIIKSSSGKSLKVSKRILH